MAAYIEHGKISRADLTERDTGDATIRFLDGFGDLAVFAATAYPTSKERNTFVSSFLRQCSFRLFGGCYSSVITSFITTPRKVKCSGGLMHSAESRVSIRHERVCGSQNFLSCPSKTNC